MAIGCSIDGCPPDCPSRDWCRRTGVYQRFARSRPEPGRRAVTGLDGVVQIAYLHREHVSHSWHESMRGLLDYDLEHGRRIARRPLNLRCGAGLVAQIRNYGARLFLDKTDHEWLLFIDTDMGFAPDAAHRLLAVADPVQRPVVGALCFAMMEAAYDGMGGWRRTIVPTMYKLGTERETGEPSFCYYGDYPVDEVVPVAGTGGAFLLIHRGALEKVRADVGDHWFEMLYDRAGDIVGEDIAFCGRLLKVGIIPVVHTGVKTTHHKELWVSEEDYLVQQAVTVRVDPGLPVHVDLGASFTALERNEHVQGGMLKLPADLDRYRQVIEATRPEVLVETGTHTGESAWWFLGRDGVAEVITVDLDGPDHLQPEDGATESVRETMAGRLTFVCGDSADPAVAARVVELVAGRRCMVVLDSDHSAEHVAREIDLYGPLVSPGCYLVVEDSIFGYADEDLRAQHGMAGMVGSPLDAIAEKLVGAEGWSRDLAVERLDPVSHHPAGWWVRHA